MIVPETKGMRSLVIGLAAAVCISYIDRTILSHAILAMSDPLGIDPKSQSVAFAAFSVGYVMFMVPAGMLADRFGPARVAALSVAAWSLVTACTVFVTGPASLIVSRLALGIAEAPIFPAAAALIRANLPLEKRGRATAVFDGGSYVGTAIAAPLVVYSMLWFGWRASFALCGMIGFGWVIVWTRSKWVQPSTRDAAIPSVPLTQLLLSRKLAGVGLGFFCYNYVKNFFLTWFPTYLLKDRGFTLAEIGVIAVIPPLAALVGETVGGIGTDHLARRNGSVSIARKVPLCAGMIGAATIALVPLAGSQVMAVALLSLSFGSLIACSPAIWALPGDLAPTLQSVGTLGGVQNTVANIGGIVSPILTGTLLARYGDFSAALTTAGGIALLGALSFGFILNKVEPITVSAPTHVTPSLS